MCTTTSYANAHKQCTVHTDQFDYCDKNSLWFNFGHDCFKMASPLKCGDACLSATLWKEIKNV